MHHAASAGQEEKIESRQLRAVATAIDSATKRLYVCADDMSFIAYDLEHAKVALSLSLITLTSFCQVLFALFLCSQDPPGLSPDAEDQGDGLLEAGDCVLDAQYLPELESVHLASHKGNLLLVHTEKRTAESVGYVKGGLTSAQWSPDQEICAIATAEGALLLMTKDWDVLYEGSQAPVSADKDKKDKDKGQAEGEREGVVSWRGDGQFFVCSSLRRGQQYAASARLGPAIRDPAALYFVRLQSSCCTWSGGRRVGGSRPCGQMGCR